ncbi:HpcH/HpaI aldolase family protein [Cellulosimicrobium cellulans]|uniref:HpcH/HpaI aldolase family protein n=1 Tax=Cellulosimicrobium cellulans TaxID=1710 RepID=UPI00130D567C|nr:aldolase/citrate lyase family protein [Cellulosimicrobium cellulans]
MYARTNLVKQKIADGQPVIGMESWLRDPRMAELLGHAGFDFLHIEYEHVARDWEGVENLVRAAELAGITPLFRTEQCVAGQPPVNQIIKALKVGAQIIMVPEVDSAETARKVVQAAKFPPLGQRGIATCDRSAREIPRPAELDVQRFGRELDDEVMLWAIIESPEAVENIDEILAVEGIDAVGFGHQDYSLTAGIGDEDSAETNAAREKVFEAAMRHGKHMWWNAAEPQAMLEQFARGIRIGLLSVDLIQVDTLLRRLAAEVRAGLPR